MWKGRLVQWPQGAGAVRADEASLPQAATPDARSPGPASGGRCTSLPEEPPAGRPGSGTRPRQPVAADPGLAPARAAGCPSAAAAHDRRGRWIRRYCRPRHQRHLWRALRPPGQCRPSATCSTSSPGATTTSRPCARSPAWRKGETVDHRRHRHRDRQHHHQARPDQDHRGRHRRDRLGQRRVVQPALHRPDPVQGAAGGAQRQGGEAPGLRRVLLPRI